MLEYFDLFDSAFGLEDFGFLDLDFGLEDFDFLDLDFGFGVEGFDFLDPDFGVENFDFLDFDFGASRQRRFLCRRLLPLGPGRQRCLLESTFAFTSPSAGFAARPPSPSSESDDNSVDNVRLSTRDLPKQVHRAYITAEAMAMQLRNMVK